MDLVERVARAMLTILRPSHNGDIRHVDVDETDIDFSELARAAIEAMREPTDEMIGEGRFTLLAGQGMVEQTLEGDAKWVWIGMIDSALGKVDA